MVSIYTNVLSDEELYYFNNHPNVLLAKSSLDSESIDSDTVTVTNTNKMVYFYVPLTNQIRTTLQTQFGLDLREKTQIPMRWIKGNTLSHIDSGPSNFANTYLLYVTDSIGELIIDSESYPIQSNTGFSFNEGLKHETINTGNVPRLLIGPMDEFAQPVGYFPINYYNSESDALNNSNSLGYSSTYTIGDGVSLPYTSWRIASNSTGSSPQNVVYNNGNTLIGDGSVSYFLYPSTPCFLEGTTILCKSEGIEKYIPVEQLKKGTLVKTALNGFVPVVLIGKGSIENPGSDERTKNRLYKCSVSKYPQLKTDLYLTGCHSILEPDMTEKQKKETINHLGKLFVTDKKYRLMACVDERAEPWNSSGTYTIYHFALENENKKMNYGVYANGGLLVETCCIHFLNKMSNMEFN